MSYIVLYVIIKMHLASNAKRSWKYIQCTFVVKFKPERGAIFVEPAMKYYCQPSRSVKAPLPNIPYFGIAEADDQTAII